MNKYLAREYKLQCLKECPVPESMALCDTPATAAQYHAAFIANDPRYTPEVETMWVLILNTRRRVRGHILIATGTLDTIQVHAREVFRPAIVCNASGVVLMHNHPSGDATPSEADIKVTRDLMRAGEL